MKTAMQELIEWLDTTIETLDNTGSNDFAAGLVGARVMANKALEKEKEQIIDFAYGCVQHISREDIEKHYNKTYNNDEINTTIL